VFIDRFSGFFFDLDGTLMDTAPDVLNTMQEVLRAAQEPIPPMDQYLIGPPLEAIFARLVPHAPASRVNQLVLDYRAIYRRLPYARSRIFSGIPRLLRALRDRDKTCFVATNKALLVTRRLLEMKGLDVYFTDVTTLDVLPGRTLSKKEMLEYMAAKHQLEPQSCVMIGDSVLDLAGGRGAGMKTAAALYGYTRREELLAAQPDFLVESEDWDRVLAASEPTPLAVL